MGIWRGKSRASTNRLNRFWESKGLYDVPDHSKERQRLKERIREAKEKWLGRRSKEISFTDEEVITILYRGHRAFVRSRNWMVKLKKFWDRDFSLDKAVQELVYNLAV